MRRVLVLAVGCVCLSACSKGSYEGHGVSWKLPRGVSFEADGAAPGATGMAQFSGGVQVKTYALTGMPAEADDRNVEEIAKKMVPEGVVAISKRGGTLPAGKVARFVWKEGANRTLLYYIPTATQVVVISLTAPENRFSGMEDHFDMSLSSLKVQ